MFYNTNINEIRKYKINNKFYIELNLKRGYDNYKITISSKDEKKLFNKFLKELKREFKL